jgi:hypothetical protein
VFAASAQPAPNPHMMPSTAAHAAAPKPRKTFTLPNATSKKLRIGAKGGLESAFPAAAGIRRAQVVAGCPGVASGAAVALALGCLAADRLAAGCLAVALAGSAAG